MTNKLDRLFPNASPFSKTPPPELASFLKKNRAMILKRHEVRNVSTHSAFQF